MNIFESISASISSVIANKTRTFLTMIGIIIGVSSVIAITSLGNGFKNTIERDFEILNTKAIQFMQNWGAELTEKDVISVDDIKIVKDHKDVKYASGYNMDRAIVNLKNPNQEETKNIIGSNPEFAKMQKNFFEMKYGRVYSEKEDEIKAKVCIIDENLAFDIFGRRDVVGEDISLYMNKEDHIFNIIGITEVLPNNFMGSNIMIPLNTFLDIYDTEDLNMLYVEINDIEQVNSAQREITRMIAANHNTTENKYMGMVNLEQINTIKSVIDIFTLFITFVAGISLLVGGIGVMNIMLVSVTERTREIGIRKSLGATSGNIKIQFLIESIIICAIGGLIGIIAGYIGSNILGQILGSMIESMTGMETMPPQLSMPVAIGAMLASSIVGIIFGVYPASKAAKLDPIEALRYE